MPTFLGGSDLGDPDHEHSNSQLATDWIKVFTSTASRRALANAGNVSRTRRRSPTINASNPQLAPFAKAAKSSWFVPTAPNWANVESANILQNMLVSILTGKRSVKAAAQRAQHSRSRRSSTQARELPAGTRGARIVSAARPGRRRRAAPSRPRAAAAPPHAPPARGRRAVPADPRRRRRDRGGARLSALLARRALVAAVRAVELIAHKGVWIGLENYTHDPPRPASSGRARAHARLHRRERRR